MKYEYKVENLRLYGMTSMLLTKDHEKKLNELGEEGWEMVNFNASAGGRNVLVVFKREKK